MKLLALEKELLGATAQAFQPLLRDEARQVWELQQSGAMREIYSGPASTPPSWCWNATISKRHNS